MIPKIIHFCWFGGNPIPEEHKKNIESWKKCCPDYEIKMWNESNYDVTKCRYMKEAYESKKWAFVSDYARLDIVAENGGFYFDTDVEIIRPLDDLRDNSAFLGMETGGRINTGLGFGAEKGNDIVRKMRDIYSDKRFINDDSYLKNHTDPDFQTSFLSKLGLACDETKQQQIGTVTIYPLDYFCPININTGFKNVTANTYSIHKFSGSWCLQTDLIARNEKWEYCQKYGEKLGGTLYLIPRAIYILRHDGFGAFWGKVKKKLKREK